MNTARKTRDDGMGMSELEVVCFLDEGFTTLMSSNVPRDAEVKVQVSIDKDDTTLVMDSNSARKQVRF
eukprot:CAMPEP_0116871558 /NCGR_PEP_ID=MMETSP0463-20121206/1974_1 /TAXON_ID=181622 /ORGANISM="Strombidinopsis sp, Strain SopsisLIS2011" /LENGTH=67 /DNA_ID=CAMNT_0004510231 /DNA_START=1829 /DNA_END=2032 /DNA_ORIENTATION=-